MIYGRIDETHVGHGVERNDGVGCSGKGVPDRSSPFVKMEKGRNDPPVPMDKTSPLAKMGEESSLVDDSHFALRGGVSTKKEIHSPHFGLDSNGSMVFRF
jgi:hypothetical protein